MHVVTDPFVAYLERKWWWSPKGPWTYCLPDGRGWSQLINLHPGMFNLAWAFSGTGTFRPSDDSQRRMTLLVQSQMHHMKLTPRWTMADAAFESSLRDFAQAYRESRLASRWNLQTPDITHKDLQARLDQAIRLSHA